jgi:hypothetical protein
MKVIEQWIVNGTYHSQGPTQLVLCDHGGTPRWFIWTSYGQWIEVSEFEARNIIQNSFF